MYATLYGQRSEVEPGERHFHRSSEGIWHLRKPALPTDAIMHAFERLNMKCLQILFKSGDQFWDALEASDFNVIHAGLDPEALCDRDEFNRKHQDMRESLERKLVYYYSIRHYNHVAQNMISHIIISLGDAYALLSESNLYENVPLEAQAYGSGQGYRNAISPAGFRIWTNFSFCIEKAISFLDFTAKYICELSHIDRGGEPVKPKARDVTFGNWGHIKLGKGTALSTMSDELRLLIALRDETVHNGTIDHFSRVYEQTSDFKVERRFALMPDHEKGRILTAAGRKRFFSQDNHLNAILPSLFDRLFGDVISSLNEIDERIRPRWVDPESYFKRHASVFDAMNFAADTGAFLKYDPSDKQ